MPMPVPEFIGTITESAPSVRGPNARMRMISFDVQLTSITGTINLTTTHTYIGTLLGVDYVVDTVAPMDTGVKFTLNAGEDTPHGPDLMGGNGNAAGLGTASCQVCPVEKDRSGATTATPTGVPLYGDFLTLKVTAATGNTAGRFIAYILENDSADPVLGME